MTSNSENTSPKSQFCFVIGPIGKELTAERKHSDLLLHAVIKHVLQNEAFNYLVKRADEDADPGMIGDRVVSDIINADLVVADLTDLNPNAFYELGIRHSTEKPTIHVAKTGTALPFDNIAHRTIFVDLTDWHSIEQARERLSSSVRAIKVPGYRVSNPITQANASFKMRESEDPRDQVIAEITDRMASLESVISRSPSKDVRVSMTPSERIKESLRSGDYDAAVHAYAQATGANLDDASKFLHHLSIGREIEAIKQHRLITGNSLQESREFIAGIKS